MQIGVAMAFSQHTAPEFIRDAVQLVEAIRGRAASRSFAARVGLATHDLDALDDGLRAPSA